MDKINLNYTIICEGKYDKIKLSSLFDTNIITTEGFNIFKNKEKIELIKKLSKNNKIIIITDSDHAGFKIRNLIKTYIKKEQIINVYIPDIFGKEKRKLKASKEGKIGVEGVKNEILKKLVITAINKNENIEKENKKELQITKLDFYNLKLSGFKNSNFNRCILKKHLNLPNVMATNSLIDILNCLYTKKEFLEIIKKITPYFK